MSVNLHTFASELGISLLSVQARGMLEFGEAHEIELAEVGADGKEHVLVPAAAEAWKSLHSTALGDNVQLFIVSAFRTVERQANIIRRKLEVGQSIAEILEVCAPPGFSEHHTGRAVDISCPDTPALEVTFDQTDAFAWLTRRAKDFGFHLSFPVGNPQGYIYEPWHWCFSNANHSVEGTR